MDIPLLLKGQKFDQRDVLNKLPYNELVSLSDIFKYFTKKKLSQKGFSNMHIQLSLISLDIMLCRFGGQEGGINDSTLILYLDTTLIHFYHLTSLASLVNIRHMLAYSFNWIGTFYLSLLHKIALWEDFSFLEWEGVKGKEFTILGTCYFHNFCNIST